MIVIPREICRDEQQAFKHEWLVSNGRGSYASASITGALTRRHHGLLVAKLESASSDPAAQTHHVLLAKLDEEVELDEHVYKLGTNEYPGDINPDGYLYLQQVAFDGCTATFSYEAGHFQLTKTVWMDRERLTTYIRYALGESSAPVSLTLVPFCDYRLREILTQGSEGWRFQIQQHERGLNVTGHSGATPYRILVEPSAAFTPLDLWYWRFQLRAENHATTDLFVPGLLRADLTPGAALTLIATCERDEDIDFDTELALERARSRIARRELPPPDEFTSDLFLDVDPLS